MAAMIQLWLFLSRDIPFNGPIAGVFRLASVDEFIINPQGTKANFGIDGGCTKEAINMVESAL